jgi:hypothetical protein
MRPSWACGIGRTEAHGHEARLGFILGSHHPHLSSLIAAVAAPSLQPASSMNGPSRPTAPALAPPSRYPRPCGSVELVPDTRSGRKGGPYKVVPAARREPGRTLEPGQVGVKPSAHRFSGGCRVFVLSAPAGAADNTRPADKKSRRQMMQIYKGAAFTSLHRDGHTENHVHATAAWTCT